jgi:hypothetical protein
MSDARKRRWVPTAERLKKEPKGWQPDSIEDDTIGITQRGTGYKRGASWVADLPTLVAEMIGRQSVVSHHFQQLNYVEVWFEARAMVNQFRYYTKGLTLVPFGGDQHIEPKWDTAKRIEEMAEIIGKPVVVLYFGDRDDKGDRILRDALKDIQEWCAVPFRVERCGLTIAQVQDFADHGHRVPENPDKPGEYQWEALTDVQAKTIIETEVNSYIDVKLIERAEKAANRYRKKWSVIAGKAVRAALSDT